MGNLLSFLVQKKTHIGVAILMVLLILTGAETGPIEGLDLANISFKDLTTAASPILISFIKAKWDRTQPG